MPPWILCVDDDPAIRQLLPPVLRSQGYQVTVACTVAEALGHIAERPFDVLIADLNIGEPGDGFTVVSAMHRTHPQCVNFILTGYPAIEAALQSIRNQVDGLVLKPTDVTQLLNTIAERVQARTHHRPSASKRLAELLRDSRFEIARRTLEAMKRQSDLCALQLSDEDRLSHIPEILQNLATMLDCPGREETRNRILRTAVIQGRIRYAQGYTPPLLMENVRIVGDAIAAVLRENLLSIDLSSVWSDLQILNDGAFLHMKELFRAYAQAEQQAA